MQQFGFLQQECLGNSLGAYLMALLVFFVSITVLNLLNRMVLKRLKQWAAKTPGRTDDFIVDVFEKMVLPLLYVAAFYFSMKQLVLNPTVEKLVTAVAVISLVVQGTRLLWVVVLYFAENFWIKQELASRSGALASKSILTILKISIWGMAVVFILDNLGFNVSAVIAGLGIGGIAVALAAQTILGDLFNYFVIFFDKPFEEGDVISVDDYSGKIEHIGIKSTRIRSVSGEQLVISNSNLTSSRIRNYKRMNERRATFKFGVTYSTDMEKLKKISPMIEKIVSNVPQTRFESAHWGTFGDSGLIFEVVYFVLCADYNKYLEIQQNINLAVKDAFDKEGIDFAHPTQTLYLNRV